MTNCCSGTAGERWTGRGSIRNPDLIDEIAALLVAADDGDMDAELQLLQRYRADDRLHPGLRVQRNSPLGDDVVLDELH